MTKPPLTVSPDATGEATLELMNAAGIDHLPVCDGARLVGMLTRNDFIARARSLHGRAGLYEELETFLPYLHVAGLMTLDPPRVTPSTTTADAMALMQRSNLTALPVVSDEGLVGIVTRRDLSVLRTRKPSRHAAAA